MDHNKKQTRQGGSGKNTKPSAKRYSKPTKRTASAGKVLPKSPTPRKSAKAATHQTTKPTKTALFGKKSVTAKKKPPYQARTADGRVPQGRTLITRDKYLDKNAEKPNKKRPVVVIEANVHNDLAVVQLSGSAGKDRTQLKKYQQGQSLFKHYVEIQDDEGNPIRVNKKFQENHPNIDVSERDVERIKDKVLYHSKPAPENQKKINIFRKKK